MERLERGGVDVVLMGLVVPDRDRLAALAKLRRCAPHVPVIVLTDSDDDAAGLRAVSAGAQDCVVKGQVTGGSLRRVLRYAIARKRIEEQLRERQVLEARAQQTQRAESLEILAGGVAHEFNNLLTGILGNVCIALAEVPADSPLRAMLVDIQTAAQRAGTITAQMLAYSGQGRSTKIDLDLSRFVTDLVPLLEPAVRERGELTVQTVPWPLPVRGAPQELRQVIISLVTNAAEALAGRDGAIRLATAAIRLAAPTLFEQGSLQVELPAGHYASITVSDTGCGIASANLPRIFDPFFTTKFTGRGLGLASLLGTVRGHGGAVKVTSAEGQGTTVQVLLPLCGEVASPAQAAAAGSDTQPWRWEGVALVVDDEPLIVSLVRKILARHGLEVLAAADWREGAERVRQQLDRLRLILVDADRLAPNPAPALAALRSAALAVPVLLWGGHSEEEAEGLFGDLGKSAFVHKPFPPSVLLARIHHLLG